MRVSDLVERSAELQFIAGIKLDCPIAVRPFISREIIDIELKIRDRPQDEET
jgi:hypothetical protein